MRLTDQQQTELKVIADLSNSIPDFTRSIIEGGMCAAFCTKYKIEPEELMPIYMEIKKGKTIVDITYKS